MCLAQTIFGGQAVKMFGGLDEAAEEASWAKKGPPRLEQNHEKRFGGWFRSTRSDTIPRGTRAAPPSRGGRRFFPIWPLNSWAVNYVLAEEVRRWLAAAALRPTWFGRQAREASAEESSGNIGVLVFLLLGLVGCTQGKRAWQLAFWGCQ